MKSAMAAKAKSIPPAYTETVRAQAKAQEAEAALAEALRFAHAREETLARLASVHREAVETARLSNLLGRTPYVAALLFIGAAGVSALLYGTVPTAPLGVWGVFMLAASLALFRLYRQTLRSAFELLPLRAFVLDLHAILLYAGFAWGAGAFLALPQTASAAEIILFAGGASAIVAGVFRARAAALYFLAPAAGLPVIAALSGSGGLVPAVAIVVIAVAIGFIAELAERLTARKLGTPPLPLFPAT
jgi:hypothetical protein